MGKRRFRNNSRLFKMSEQLKLFNVDTEVYRVQSKSGAVPFVDEVEEFNSTFNKPNNYEPTISAELRPELCRYQEVQASNLSKSCSTEEEAVETVSVRSKEQNEPCHYEKVGERYVVYRTRDRKVMKSINYFKPDLLQFFTSDELSKFI